MAFESSGPPDDHPAPPADVVALLEAGGHNHYLLGESGRWVSVTDKGIRFADAKGKRKVAAVPIVGHGGPVVVLMNDDRTALVAGRYEALRVDLETAKKEVLFSKSFNEIDALAPTSDGTAFVAPLRGDEYMSTALRVYDLGGKQVRDIAYPPAKFIREVVPLWDDLVAIVFMGGVHVVDLGKDAVVAMYEGSVKETRKVGRRFTLSLYSEEYRDLR